MSARHRHHRGLRRRAEVLHQRELRRARVRKIMRDTYAASITDAIFDESPLMAALNRRRPGNRTTGT